MSKNGCLNKKRQLAVDGKLCWSFAQPLFLCTEYQIKIFESLESNTMTFFGLGRRTMHFSGRYSQTLTRPLENGKTILARYSKHFPVRFIIVDVYFRRRCWLVTLQTLHEVIERNCFVNINEPPLRSLVSQIFIRSYCLFGSLIVQICALIFL